jgi:Spy/CpxP family protein refolding chaperone
VSGIVFRIVSRKRDCFVAPLLAMTNGKLKTRRNTMNRKYVLPIIGLFAVLSALVVAGCYHKTPEQRAEHVIKHLVSTLNLNADQTAKLEKMKEEFLAKRPDIQKMRTESMADLKEMMLSPQIDRATLGARTEKIQAHAGDMIKFLSAKFAELHDILTPEQRSKLVAEMEKHAERHRHW